MAQIKIEITYDPSTETLAQAVSSLVPKAAASTAAVTGKNPEAPATPKSRPAATAAAEPESTPKSVAEPEPKTETAAEPKGASAAATTGSKPEGEPKTVSKTDVRAVATALSKAGKRDKLSAIFAEFGGKKLSDIKEEDYPALMEKLEAANG